MYKSLCITACLSLNWQEVWEQHRGFLGTEVAWWVVRSESEVCLAPLIWRPSQATSYCLLAVKWQQWCGKRARPRKKERERLREREKQWFAENSQVAHLITLVQGLSNTSWNLMLRKIQLIDRKKFNDGPSIKVLASNIGERTRGILTMTLEQQSDRKIWFHEKLQSWFVIPAKLPEMMYGQILEAFAKPLGKRWPSVAALRLRGKGALHY